MDGWRQKCGRLPGWRCVECFPSAAHFETWGADFFGPKPSRCPSAGCSERPRGDGSSAGHDDGGLNVNRRSQRSPFASVDNQPADFKFMEKEGE